MLIRFARTVVEFWWGIRRAELQRSHPGEWVFTDQFGKVLGHSPDREAARLAADVAMRYDLTILRLRYVEPRPEITVMPIPPGGQVRDFGR